MGFLKEKESCAICGGKLNAILKTKISDGNICRDCRILCSRDIRSIDLKTTCEVQEHLAYRKQNQLNLQSFHMTDRSGDYVRIDENNKLFCFPENKNDKNPDLFKFDELIDYEYIEDGETISKGGLGSATVGGVLFGGAGAIVGGLTGKKKSKTVVNDMHVRVSLSNPWISQKIIRLSTGEIKKNSITYKLIKDSADKIISILDLITNHCSMTSNTVPTHQPVISGADEIMKYKGLLDAGVISQEEFDAKKKQLLGL